MTTPFRGVVNLDVRDSVPDWAPYEQTEGAGRRAERGLHRARRCRLRRAELLRRDDRHAEHRQDRRARGALQRVAHDRAVLADPLVPADRAQPHHQRDGVHHRGRRRLPERQRPHPAGVRDAGRGAGRARVQHRRRRQVASDRRGRDEHGLDQGELAAGSRLRTLLRLPRRGDQPVVSGPDPRQPPGGTAVLSPRTATTSASTSPTRPSRTSTT